MSIKNAWLLIKELYQHPNNIGAVYPSSDTLATKMANQVPLNHPGVVIEIGAGTGPITKALLQRGIDANRLIVIENSYTLYDHLRKRFPQIQIIAGDAVDLELLLPRDIKINAIVSSLPLRSLPPKKVVQILEQFHKILTSDGLLIQYTYDIFSRKERYLSQFKLRHTYPVWLNLPPAKVQVFSKKG